MIFPDTSSTILAHIGCKKDGFITFSTIEYKGVDCNLNSAVRLLIPSPYQWHQAETGGSKDE